MVDGIIAIRNSLVAFCLLLTLLLSIGAPSAGATEIYRFKGKGTAHGVGLDMAGVKVLAEQGKDYPTILHTYYTGVSFGNRSDFDKIVYQRSDGTKVEMRMRDYLARLAEEPDSWPREGLRALIVTARSYAWNKMDNGGVVPSWGQNYLESITDPTATRPNIVQAVTDTESKILTYNGKAIMAAYHGNSGGKTESSEYVLGGSASTYPYLRGVNSPWTPLYSWEFSLTRAELEAIFNADPVTYIGTLYGIDLSNKAPSGRVYKARLIGSAGVKDVWGYFKFASKLGAKIGKSIGSYIEIVPDGWEEGITITNPTGSDASVNLRVNGESAVSTASMTVPAHRTRRLSADSYVANGGVTVEISSNQPVVAERGSRYLYARTGYKGAYSDIGSPTASKTWYMPDGYVGEGVDTVLTMQNPQAVTASVTATFMNSAGAPVTKVYNVAAHKFYKVRLSSAVPTGWVATKITSNQAILADRTMYFANDGISTVGAKDLSRFWYFAEGNTRGASTRVNILNPNSASTGVTVSFLRERGNPVTRRFNVGANKRIQIRVEAYLQEGFAVKVRSALPVAVDKAVYLNAGGKRSGSSTVGAAALSKRWYFPDGSSDGAKTFILVANPNTSSASVSVRFATPDGRSYGRKFTVGAYRRISVYAGSYAPRGATFSTTVSGSLPVVAEKAAYSAYGLTGTIGAPAAATTWFLAEGYTGP